MRKTSPPRRRWPRCWALTSTGKRSASTLRTSPAGSRSRRTCWSGRKTAFPSPSTAVSPSALRRNGCFRRWTKKFGQIGFSRTWQKISKGHFIDPNCELVTTLLDIYSKATGKRSEAISIGGGTYARAFENAVAFGVEPVGEPAQAHMPDESCPVESVRFDTRLMAEAIVRLAGK